MTSDVEERPELITVVYGRHVSQPFGYRGVLRDSFVIQIGSHVTEPDVFIRLCIAEQ